ncbi:PapB/FocB family fimbrial expression transcriptional regulator [Salmonella enterica]|uniref:PapB/FocB family fimbrial expression transcriptional regulator n=1 Tax=Salmonella enterica TaxID=28901 RepID=UPI003CEEDA66
MADRSLEPRGRQSSSKSKKSKLMQAELSEEHFLMLAEISPFRSEKVIYALRDFLVFGYTRREVCERYGVSPSYFSVSLGRMSHVNRVVFSLIPYYSKEQSSVGYLTVPNRS